MTRFIFTILATVWCLYGCGFAPMYGEMNGRAETVAELNSVTITAPSDELGSRLQNQLGDLLHGGGAPASTKYVLEVDLSSVETKGGYRIDASVTREQISLIAKYRLIDSATGNTLMTGKRTERSSIDVLQSQFATLVSRDNALDRATKELSQFIQADLSVYFDRQRNIQARQSATAERDPS